MNKNTAYTLAALSLVILASGCVPYKTGPTEVGVRTVKIGFNRGVEDRVYPPGSTFFFPPFITDWHTFDTKLNNLEMSAVEMGAGQPGRDDIIFKSIDGNDIGLDVIISYKIDPAMAPRILKDVASSNEELRDNIVRTVARSRPRDVFGELLTEEFYLPEKRTAKAEEAREVLNEILNPLGVIIERVSTGDYRFNPAYQQAISDRKVADQEAEKLKSETKAAEEEYIMKVEEAKGDIARTMAEADGEFERSKIEADAYFEQQSKFAEAIETEGRAEAEAILKMNEALAGEGGDAMIRLRIAEALKGKKIVMLPIGGDGLDVRTTDVNALLQLYGLQNFTGSGKNAAE